MARLSDIRVLGQSVWLDFLSRKLVESGQLSQLMSEGLSGVTSNPTIFHKSITAGDDYDDSIRAILKSQPEIETKSLYDQLIIEDIQFGGRRASPGLC